MRLVVLWAALLAHETPCPGLAELGFAEGTRFQPGVVVREERLLRSPDENELNGAIDLSRYVRELLARNYATGFYRGEHGFRNFGDVLVWFSDALGTPAALDARLAELARVAPAIHNEIGWILPELLGEDHLHRRGWQAKENHARDGFLSLRGWWPWMGYYEKGWPEMKKKSIEACQVATLVFHRDAKVPDACAAYGRVLESYRDVDRYDRWRGLDDDLISAAIAGSPATREGVTSYRIEFEVHSFFAPDFDLIVREQVSETGLLREYHSAGDAWRFFAGREEWLPVHASDGSFVALFGVGTVAFTGLHGDVAARVLMGNAKRCAVQAAGAKR